MKVRIYSQENDETIGDSVVKGRPIVKPCDDVGFSTYEIRIRAGDSLTLGPCFGANYNHIYYCILGEGEADCSNKSTFDIIPQSVLALASTTTATLTARTNMRIAAIFVEVSTPPPTPAKFVPLSDIVGTDRDIDWTRGHSRRYLRRDDGFGLSIHNTIVDPSIEVPLQYKNNHELGYYVFGDIKYEWDDGKSSAALDIEKIKEDGDGIGFLMNEQDAHIAKSGKHGCECLCVFNPPLKGNETHDFSKGSFSLY